ncbi:LacI family DNA-binding transcriptional regulator [Geminisphaera colitermitum]|uniref:LacI family DNA-binding transcriptional regulator n=1 Tax=Geminisphaera colitermitum TaxID=1148786 RepID=UPI000158C767|nr:LacI family DNA-binding transcriptional regulator [Geminisphaera colitermitum]
MATIYDIARTAKVSPATVSRVINGRAGVKDETVALIRKTMETNRFQPRWKAIDRNRLLVLVPEHRGALDSGYTSRILSGITDTAFASGFGLQLRPFVPQIRNNRELKQMVMNESVAGIIIVTMFQGYSLAEKLSLSQIPHAIVGNKTQDDGVSQILLDDRNAGLNATRYLLSLRHRHIAMVSFKHADHGHQQRYAGYLEALNEKGPHTGATTPGQCIETDITTIEEGRAAARRLLSLPERPTAVIVTNEDLAIGFQLEAREMGLRIPEDISIIAFEDTEKTAFLDIPMTTMRIPAHTMGIEAVKMLFSMLNSEDSTPRRPHATATPAAACQTVTLPLSLIVRRSTATAP